MNNKGFTLVELVIFIFAICIILPLIVAVVGFSVYGLVLCFKASIILGILALIVEPSPPRVWDLRGPRAHGPSATPGSVDEPPILRWSTMFIKTGSA